MSKPVKNFYEFIRIYLSQTEVIPGSKISKDWEKMVLRMTVYSLFYAFGIRKGTYRILHAAG